MSLLSRRLSGSPAFGLTLRVAGASTLLAGTAAQAQQLVFNPRVELTGEWDSNRLLVVNNPPTGEWVQALLAGDMTRTTDRSTFDLRPVVIFQDSTLKAVDALEASVTGKYTYLTLKTEYDVVAQYNRQDSYNSEYGLSSFNPLNPDAPATEGSGQIITGITRDSYQISPSMNHTFTERFNAELDTSFVAVRYSTQIPEELVSFNAPAVGLNGVWAVSQRGKLAVGPFYQEYDPVDGKDEGTLKSRSYGANIGYRYLTTRTTNSSITLKVGRDEQEQFIGPTVGTTTWGLEWKGTYNFQTGQLQFAVGRFLEPSSIGGEIGLYQIRGQFSRKLSATMSASVSARITREQGIGIEDFGNRDRGYGEIDLSKVLTREFSLTGGFRWLFQKLPTTITNQETGLPETESPTAKNYGVFLTIGWHPLESR
jgi:hypothetical protein